MATIQKLISLSSGPLASKPGAMPRSFEGYLLGAELVRILHQKNGFYAFESALHFFPLTSNPKDGVEAWNAGSLWRNKYGDLAEGLLFFAENILQDQFCLSKQQNGVLRFHAEAGRITIMANSLEEWAGLFLLNYQAETGWPLAHAWQAKYGPLLTGNRLLPKTPFFMGGEYEIENLWAGDAVEGMRLKGDLAVQTRDLPDGATIKVKIAPRPE